MQLTLPVELTHLKVVLNHYLLNYFRLRLELVLRFEQHVLVLLQSEVVVATAFSLLGIRHVFAIWVVADVSLPVVTATWN
jgi:hypothetical protein